MVCQKCGYAMDAFEIECKRCKNLGEKTSQEILDVETPPLENPQSISDNAAATCVGCVALPVGVIFGFILGGGTGVGAFIGALLAVAFGAFIAVVNNKQPTTPEDAEIALGAMAGLAGGSLNKTLGLKNMGGFSLNRALGITRMKSKASRAIGIPFTKSGRQRKIGGAIWKL